VFVRVCSALCFIVATALGDGRPGVSGNGRGLSSSGEVRTSSRKQDTGEAPPRTDPTPKTAEGRRIPESASASAIEQGLEADPVAEAAADVFLAGVLDQVAAAPSASGVETGNLETIGSAALPGLPDVTSAATAPPTAADAANDAVTAGETASAASTAGSGGGQGPARGPSVTALTVDVAAAASEESLPAPEPSVAPSHPSPSKEAAVALQQVVDSPPASSTASSAASAFKVGDYAIAVWSEDGVEYLARVEGVNDAGTLEERYHVVFVEYGNKQPDTPLRYMVS
jgi:hypothetical protein